jgi:SAM-dependent methyltransferase
VSPAARGPKASVRGPRRSGDDPELAAGTRAHYEDPSYYARTYARRKDDVAFYVARAATVRGSVLEYGCGNGRITLPMARAGARVVGVDLSAPICPFNALLHLYERPDVEAFLARVRAHLAPRGSFVFDISVPDPGELARSPERLYRTRPFVYPGVGKVRYGERFDYDPLRQVLFVSMEFEPMNGSPPFMTPLAHRQFYPRELEALLHYAGFEVTEWIGDFDGRATTTTRQLAVVARVRRGR